MSVRDTMVASAAALFRQRGVAGTSLRDVVAHAGAPRGSIYHHFPGGKAELANAATDLAGGFIERLLTGVLDSGDPAGAITAFVDYWSRSLTAHDFADGCPVAAAAVSSDETAGARARAGRAFARWQEQLATALMARGMASDLAVDRAGLAIAAVEGALLVARAQRSTEPLERVARQLTPLLAS
ncbi:TetR/AcrR family transcriptional regulator [Nocardioides jiangxiensis]|uniref:TetR/AcrR family transcriptional regulator n=1 Tax=Nocardioides jiangxiensis TaxID=3064524 RepID=A0ABT9AX98_9ACTN|nr:TetR/AcrR family transcriptional regulator [Nocardioides sp. WY-20]MDO7867156.1 TetR/AcrR family transcriptional regulator [Nocardioides sp. WY-20]